MKNCIRCDTKLEFVEEIESGICELCFDPDIDVDSEWDEEKQEWVDI